MRQTVLFADGNDQQALWATDGTVSGTVELTGVNNSIRDPHEITAFGGRILLAGVNAQGDGLWNTNGTAAGTFELTGIAGASDGGASLNPSYLTVLGGEAFFDGTDTAHDQNLWVTDGTVAGTFELTGVAGVSPNGLDPTDLTVSNGKIFFSGDALVSTPQQTYTRVGLWVSDGTASGTHEVNVNGTVAGGIHLTDLSAFGNHVLFEGTGLQGGYHSSDLGLWISDGTTAGTLEIAHSLDPGNFAVFNDQALFSALDANSRPQLWVTDGTAGGTSEITGIAGTYSGGLNPTDLTAFNGELLFAGADASSTQTTVNIGLWITNGTSAGTYEITGISNAFTHGLFGSGMAPDFTVFNGEVLFNGQNAEGHFGLWVTNGTAAGTHELTGISGAAPYGINPQDLTQALIYDPPDNFAGGSTSGILWYNSTTGDVGDWLMNNGTPQWHGLSGSQTTWQIQGIGDFTGDGTSDVLWRNSSTGQVLDWVMNNNQPQQQILGPSSTSFQIAGVGDFNGDGTSDILWYNPTNGGVGEWLMNHNTPTWEAVTGTNFSSASLTMNIAGIGDFTGGGNSDILWENPSNGLVGMWAMNGSQATWSLLGQGSTTMNVVGTGDFTGNGTDDVLWENPSNGVVGFWGMNNGQLASWNVVATANTAYQVAGVGDYSGTGIDDILWRNATTGDVGVWAMNNGQAAWHDLGASSTTYNIVKG